MHGYKTKFDLCGFENKMQKMLRPNGGRKFQNISFLAAKKSNIFFCSLARVNSLANHTFHESTDNV